MTPVKLEPAAPRSRVKHSTTELPRSQTIHGTRRKAIIADKQTREHNIVFIYYPSVKAYVLGAQKNRLIVTVLLSTHNTCFC